uniref:Uncharacterized protein n=1 Tax=Anopheles christyi TaxID=43041 RepID=A0A182K7Y7_9DIPT
MQEKCKPIYYTGKLEGRTVEYSRPGGGLDYHNSPLIGEIAAGGDYSQFHRSIDQLRSLNERGILGSAPNTQLTVTFTPIQNNGNNPPILGYNHPQQQQQQQQQPQHPLSTVQQQLSHQQHSQLPQHHLQQQQQQQQQQPQQNQKPFLSNGIVTHHEFSLKPSNGLNTVGVVPGNISLAVNGLLVGSNGVPLVDDRLNSGHLGVDSGNHCGPNASVNPATISSTQRANAGGSGGGGVVANSVPPNAQSGPAAVGGGVNAGGAPNSSSDQIDLELKQFIVEKKEQLDNSCPPSPANGVLLMQQQTQQQQQLLEDEDDLLDDKDSKVSGWCLVPVGVHGYIKQR